jgi:serine/threonine-protein kinase
MADPARALAERYRLERALGQGGMATVYLARDLKHDRDVALKVLRPDLAAALGRERFLNEIRLTARLEHPHIVTLIDSGETEGVLWYALPFIRGESLRDRLRRERQLPLADALDIARQVASALDYAHAQGVIHRDLKPENILLHEGEAMLADFGIALALQEAGAGRLTETGLSLGTPHYMSPEQATGDRALDARSDIYALGAVLYEMLAGEPPHTGATAQAVIAKLMTERPTPLRVVRDAVPRAVDAAVGRSLAKTPADRFATAREFAEALVRQVAEPGERPHRGRTLALAAAGGIAVLAALYAWRRIPAAPAAPAAAGPIRLAVLPFESVGDSGDRTFGDGMSEAILDRLANLPRLSVMGRASVLRYPSSGQTPLEFARALGVEYVLNGTVRWATTPGGTREVRISPELIRIADGTRVWGEPYEGPLADVFALQGSVAQRVAAALRVALGAGEQALVRGAPTADVEAYRSYLLGRQILGTRWWAGEEAVRHFESAIRRDSAFARAYAGLSIAYSLAWDFGDRTWPRDTVYGRARAAARRALALDSTLSEAHTALGRLLDAGDWDWRGAEVEFRRALALDSADASARQWYVMHLLGLGRTGEALREARTAVRFDPLTPLTINALGLAFWFDGQPDSAIRVFREVLAWDSTGSVVPNLMGVYGTEGRAREAEALVQRWPAILRRGDTYVLIARVRAGEPVRAEALRSVREDITKPSGSQERRPSFTILAGGYALLGERDSALVMLERAVAGHEERLMVALKAWPALASLRDEPRYRAVVRRVGLPE